MCKTQNTGFIKIHRSLIDWGWSDDPNTLALWIHILMGANWKDGVWHGEAVKRGQLCTSTSKLSALTGLSDKQVRICLDRLVDGGEIIKEGTNKWTKITVCKYDSYQCDDDDEWQANGEQAANKGQSNGKQRATIEESKKEIKKEDNNKIDVNKSLAEAADRLYKLYPSSVVRAGGNRASLKTSNDKKKLIRLLATHTEEELADIIRQYLAEDHGAYLKMFSTFLNNLPDYSDDPSVFDAGANQQPKQSSVSGFKINSGGLLDGIEY